MEDIQSRQGFLATKRARQTLDPLAINREQYELYREMQGVEARLYTSTRKSIVMPRKTHRGPEEACEDIRRRVTLSIPPNMLAFLELEAKRVSEESGKLTTPPDVVRALVTAYYEKKMAGLLIGPDD